MSQDTQQNKTSRVPVRDEEDPGDPPQSRAEYGQIREDVVKLLENLGDFVQSGRRPHYLSEDAQDRLVAAFDALIEEVLDVDDELEEDLNLTEALNKVRLLRAIAGL